MATHERLKSLTQRHADIELTIAEEAQRPNPDTLRLTELKKQKLRIKEEMAGIHAH